MTNETRAALRDEIAELLKLVEPAGTPNINALTEAIRDLPAMALTIKFFGYELARALAAALPVRESLSPRKVELKSKPSTQADIESEWVAYWASQIKVPVVFHRKIWELCYVPQALYNFDLLQSGKRGIGFGCGVEPLPSMMANLGVDVVVTDLNPVDSNAMGWTKTNQHTAALNDAYQPHIVSRDLFDKHVSLEYVDMNSIPSHLRDFDFCWSICALEHLGSIEKGLDFIENSLDTLRPGGVAVHTTEFNFLRDDITFDNCGTVLFQRRHFEELYDRLTRGGYQVSALSFDVGSKPMDKFIDTAPFIHDLKSEVRHTWGAGLAHLKLSVDGIPSTCFGIITRKP